MTVEETKKSETTKTWITKINQFGVCEQTKRICALHFNFYSEWSYTQQQQKKTTQRDCDVKTIIFIDWKRCKNNGKWHVTKSITIFDTHFWYCQCVNVKLSKFSVYFPLSLFLFSLPWCVNFVGSCRHRHLRFEYVLCIEATRCLTAEYTQIHTLTRSPFSKTIER